MVTTQSAVLPWSRPSLTGDPTPAPARAAAATGAAALDKPDIPANGGSAEFNPFGKDGFSFLDLIDVINPLQHIPLIDTLYREMTGDTIDPLPRIAGSTLFFGPIGAAFAGANVVVEQISGQDVGDHIMTALKSGGVGLATAAAETAPPHAVSVIAKQPAAAGTDAAFAADDPVSAWARGELTYRAELARGRDVAGLDRGRDLAAAATPAVKDAIPDISRFAAALGLAEPKRAANAYREAQRRAGGDERAEASAPTRRTVASSEGAVAPGGGWFAANMMDAMRRYEKQKTEAGPARPGVAAALH